MKLQYLKTLSKITVNPYGKIILLLVFSRIIAFIYLFNLDYVEPYDRLKPDEWWLIFHRWDSAFYDRIASLGYVDLRHWAFLPAFPAIIRIISAFTNHSGVATALAGLICGITWIPIYYKIAAIYTDNEYATYSTLIFAFFPTVYLFTSVGYSEGLWLTNTLLGWYLFLKERYFISSIVLAFSILTRIPGFILPAVILLYTLFYRRNLRGLFYLIPFSAMLLWLLYGYTQTGEVAAPIAAQTKTVWNPHLNFLEVFIFRIIRQDASSWNEYSSFTILLVAVFLYLYIRAFDVDKILGVYSFSLLALYLITGYFLSLPRFLPFTFPIWIKTGKAIRNKYSLSIYISINYILAILLWSQFLNDRWCG
jgi:hypothetical protein